MEEEAKGLIEDNENKGKRKVGQMMDDAKRVMTLERDYVSDI